MSPPPVPAQISDYPNLFIDGNENVFFYDTHAAAFFQVSASPALPSGRIDYPRPIVDNASALWWWSFFSGTWGTLGTSSVVGPPPLHQYAEVFSDSTGALFVYDVTHTAFLRLTGRPQ